MGALYSLSKGRQVIGDIMFATRSDVGNMKATSSSGRFLLDRTRRSVRQIQKTIFFVRRRSGL